MNKQIDWVMYTLRLIGVGDHSILGGLTQAAQKLKIQKLPENLPNFKLLLQQVKVCIATCLNPSKHNIFLNISWSIWCSSKMNGELTFCIYDPQVSIQKMIYS